MNLFKYLIKILIAVFLVSTIFRSAQAQTKDEIQMFFTHNYVGISIKVDASREVIPDENVTVELWINCTAIGVEVNYLNLSIYGFKDGQEKNELKTFNAIENSSLVFNQTDKYYYDISVPRNVWGVIYAEILLRYNILSLNFEYNPSFFLTIIRNIYYEQLQEEVQYLNNSYWELRENFTALQENLIDYENTRRLAVLLGITTIFLLATTIYFFTRKPKVYWSTASY